MSAGKVMSLGLVIAMIGALFAFVAPNNAETGDECIVEFFTVGDWEGTGAGKIYIYPSNGDGTFGDKQEIGDVGGRALGLTIADYDNDGDTDVTAVSSTGKVYLIVNNCNGTFTQNEVATGLNLNYRAQDSANMDFNSDGYYDFLVPSYNSIIYLFTNNQDNTFTITQIDASWLNNPEDLHYIYGMDAGDFDENGDMDFVVVEYNSRKNDPPYQSDDDNIWLYRGNGDGTFTWELALRNRNRPGNISGETRSAAAGDFNTDGHLDLIVGQDDDGDPGQTWLYLGDGTGSFSLPIEAFDTNTIRELDQERSGGGIADAYDFDHDDILDVVATGHKHGSPGENEYGTWYFKGNGDGTFQNGMRVDTYIGLGIAAPPHDYTVTYPPVADAGIDQIVIMSDVVQFDGSGSYDQDGTIVTYEWDFDANDGLWWETGALPDSVGPTPTHTYVNYGVFTVTLRVTDDDGFFGIDTCKITVLAPSPPLLYINISQDGKDVVLNWDLPITLGIGYYLIYRSTSQINFDFDTVWVNTSEDKEPGEPKSISLRTMWNDTNAAFPGNVTNYEEQYYYIIRAVNVLGDVSRTSRTVGKWTKTFPQGVSTFSLPLEPLQTMWTYSFAAEMGANYIKRMDTTTHTWLEDNIPMNVGKGFEVCFPTTTNYTFTGMPGSHIFYKEGFGFDATTRANLTAMVDASGNVTLAWPSPTTPATIDFYRVFRAEIRDGFFSTSTFTEIGTTVLTTYNDPYIVTSECEFYYMVVPYNAIEGNGSGTYSIGVWTEEYLSQYDTIGIPLKLVNHQTADWYCDNIPNTVGINYYINSEQRWGWHSTRMHAGAYDPMLEMTEGYQISTSSATKFTFIGV